MRCFSIWSCLLLLFTAAFILETAKSFTAQSRFHPQRSIPLFAIRRRPTKLKDWEVMGDGNQGKEGKSSGSGKKRINNDQSQHESSTETVSNAGELLGLDLKQGLVLERYGDRLLVELENTAEPIVCCQRSKMSDATIVVGDMVDLFLEQGSSGANSTSFNPDFQGVVTSHRPRKTLLQRPATSGSGNGIRQMKVIAANVDQVILVVCASPRVPPSSIDRILVAAHEYGMGATIVLNKIDDIEGTQLLRDELKYYPKLGYSVLEVSVEKHEGIDELQSHLKDKCSVFVGQSGVGKSSLVNSLLPDVSNQKIGALVKNINIGAHTTSSARLFRLAGGGSLIDSPGIRELGVWHLPPEAITAGFFEIAELAAKCKFRNCKHDQSSLGCAVQEALQNGELSELRYRHYRELTD